MTAPTPAEQDTIARFEAAADAEESLRERVARAINESQRAHDFSGFPCRCGWENDFGLGWEDRASQHRLTAQADAAIAVMRPARAAALTATPNHGRNAT